VERITPAASVLLARQPGSHEVFLVKRGRDLRFFGGFWAFPGGKVAADDDPAFYKQSAAARELFEETGTLLARRADGCYPTSGSELDHLRRELLADKIPFAKILTDLGLTLWPEDFQLIGDVTTPAFAPLRFETTFFVANLPPGQQPEIWPGELEEGRWANAADMLASWTRGECLLSPPTLMTLQAIANCSAQDAPARLGPLLASLQAGKIHPIFFAPGVQMIPLRTMGLPPSTHTNAFLIGTGPIYLLDPGPAEPDEQARLFDLLEEHAQAGRRLTAIVLSHHHPDHIGAANACAERFSLPIWAHSWTEEKLKDRITVTRTIQDGEHLPLGRCPDGSGAWHLEAVHTPGHAPGHLVFYEPRYRLLFVADMISTVSSVVIVPPEGDLTLYMQSLTWLHSFDCRLLLPAHGNVSAQVQKTIDDAIDHRIKREEQLVLALADGAHTIDELAPELYKGLPEPLMRFAKLQILAGLIKLQREGRAEQSEDRTAWKLSTKL
jgi:glyoxylase-like metal-dependent hydrolase (beta-lactamase superfamily II)/8-oxo-dGTP pyrophosphatase MutT (NUDIX family)